MEQHDFLCECCKASHNGEYASGRFCSIHCSKKFSSLEKRKLINQKVRQTLLEKKLARFVELKCEVCGVIFQRSWNRRHQATCSRSCGTRRSMTEEARRNISERAIERIELKGSWYGSKCEFNLVDSKISCDSILELTCLKWFMHNKCISLMKRSEIWIPYNDLDGKTRHYNPDFEIVADGKTFIVEVLSKRQGRNDVWNEYIASKQLKIPALQKFCEERGFIPFLFDQTIDANLYRKTCSERRRS